MGHCNFCGAELKEGTTVCPSCGRDNADVTQEVLEQEAENVTCEAQEPAEKKTEEDTGTQEENTPAEDPEAEDAKAEDDGDSEEKDTAGEASGEPKEEKEPSMPIQPGVKMTPGKVAAAVAGLVILLAAVAALVLWGMKDPIFQKEEEPQQTDSSTQAPETEPTESPTIPEDGDPDNETCKGSYSASDEEVIAARDTVIATAGEYTLTLGQLQIYYWQEVSAFLNQYGSYASYFGLDYTQPLDTQSCGIMEGRTWQQYFLATALNSWRTYQALDAKAAAEGFEMEQELKDYLAELPKTMEEEAVSKGFEGTEDLLRYNVGAGASIDDYVKFMEVYYRGYSYFNDFYSKLTATDEEIADMFALHEEEYAQQGLTRDTKTVNVRHILIYPEGATTDTIRTETFSDEAWAAGEASAQALLEEWLQGDHTEDSFAALAQEHSQDPGSAANGGLYTDVYEGDMVEAFDAWCFDPQRKVGDFGIVKTEFGYHIMFYSGETIQWPIHAKNDVINEKANNMVDEAVEVLPIQTDYEKILLAVVELAA